MRKDIRDTARTEHTVDTVQTPQEIGYHPAAYLSLSILLVMNIGIVFGAWLLFTTLHGESVSTGVAVLRGGVTIVLITGVITMWYMSVKATYCVVTDQDVSFIWDANTVNNQ